MAELGNKHECLNCGTKFYDLGRARIVCPSCGSDQDELADQEKVEEGSARRRSSKSEVLPDAEVPSEDEDVDDELDDLDEEVISSEE
jgi:uncharacterized protein (TIGR02300 family)